MATPPCYWRGLRAPDEIGALTAEQKVYLVDIQQLGNDTRHERRVRLVIVGEQLHRPAKQPAFGIDILDPDLHA